MLKLSPSEDDFFLNKSGEERKRVKANPLSDIEIVFAWHAKIFFVGLSTEEIA